MERGVDSERTTAKARPMAEATARTRAQLSKHAPLTTHGLPRAPSQRSGDTTSPHRFAASPASTTSPTPSIASSLHVSPAVLRIAANARAQTTTAAGDETSSRLQKVPSAQSVDSSPLTPQSDVFSYKQIASATSSRATSIAPSSPIPGKIGGQVSRTNSPVSPPPLRSPKWPSSNSLDAAARSVQSPPAPRPQIRPMRLNTSAAVAPPLASQVRSSPSKTRSRPPPLELPRYTSSRVAKQVKTKPSSPRHLSPGLPTQAQTLPFDEEEKKPAIVYSDLPLRRVEVTLPQRYQNASLKSPMLARLSQRVKTGLRSHFHKKPEAMSPSGKDNESRSPKLTLRERRKGRQYNRREREELVEEVEALHWTEM